MTGGVNVDTMQNLFNWPLWHWHFEVSSICTLKCPRCPRTEIPESLVQTQLRLDFFEKNFTFADQIKKITFCGDDGDPIYARDFLSIVNFFKQQNPSVNINIITNGSYKTPDWWKNLGNVLNENDQVHFSLDGWDQQSNEQYRVNCDWDSIMSGIHSLRENTTAFLQWDAIVFKFNQHQIDNMKSMAKEQQSFRQNELNQWAQSFFQSIEFGSSVIEKESAALKTNNLMNLASTAFSTTKKNQYVNENSFSSSVQNNLIGFSINDKLAKK